MEKIDICRRENGKLVLAEISDSLFKIPNFNYYMPVAVISIICDQNNLRTEYANKITSYLRERSCCTVEHCEPNDIPAPFQDVSNQLDSSKICLWPEAFYLRSQHRTIVVSILLVQYSLDDPISTDVDSLEVFLSLACSRVVEIYSKKIDFRFQRIHQTMMTYDEEFCDKGCKSYAYLNTDDENLRSPNNYSAIESAINERYLEPKLFIKKAQRGELIGNEMAAFFEECLRYCNKLPELSFGKTASILRPSFSSTSKLNDSKESQQDTASFRNTQKGLIKQISNINVHSVNLVNGKSTMQTQPNQGIFTLSPLTVDKQTPIALTVASVSTPHSSKTKTTVKIIRSQNAPIRLDYTLSKQAMELIEIIKKDSMERLNEWNVSGSQFEPNAIVDQIVQESFNKHINLLQVLTPREQQSLKQSSIDHLMYSNIDIGGVKTTLDKFVLRNITDPDSYALRMVVNYNVLKISIAKGEKLPNEISRNFLMKICDNLFRKYINEKQHNDVFLLSIEQIRVFFAEELDRCISFGPFSKNECLKIERLLLDKCVSSLLGIMKWYYSIDLSKNGKLLNKYIKESLHPQFKSFIFKNRQMLAKQQKILTKIIMEVEAVYNEMINDRNNAGKCQSLHQEAQKTAVQQLNAKIRNEMRPNEPVSLHKQTLLAMIKQA